MSGVGISRSWEFRRREETNQRQLQCDNSLQQPWMTSHLEPRVLEAAYRSLWEQNVHISFQLHIQWCDFGSFLSFRVGFFTSWKLVNTTCCVFLWELVTKIPLLLSFWAPLHTVSAALHSQISMLIFTYYAVRCKGYKFIFIETPVFITESVTAFPFRRKEGRMKGGEGVCRGGRQIGEKVANGWDWVWDCDRKI